MLPLTLLISSKNCCFVSIFIPRNTLSIYKFCNYISIVCSILIPSAKSPSPDPKISATSGLKSIFFCTLSKHVINFFVHNFSPLFFVCFRQLILFPFLVYYINPHKFKNDICRDYANSLYFWSFIQFFCIVFVHDVYYLVRYCIQYFLYLFYFHKNLKKIIAAETKLLFCFCCYYKNDDVLTNIFL